jgi:thiamine biosynthesis lipoprotein
VRLATQAMATRFELVLAGPDEVLLRSAGEAALAEIEDCDRRLSWFSHGSVTSYLNTHAPNRPVQVDDETFDLLRTCLEVWRESGGAFDITVAPLMKAWGFRGEGGTDEEIAGARTMVGSDAIELDESARTVRFRRPGLNIEFGAIGKGHALDLAAPVLRDCGITCALLHGGTSSVVAIGAPAGVDSWVIAIGDDPGAPAVCLRDRALSVSSPRGRTIERNGKVLGHVLDPRTGQPTMGPRRVAVIAESARLAEAWSTALLVGADAPDGLRTLVENDNGEWTTNTSVPARRTSPLGTRYFPPGIPSCPTTVESS